MNPIDTLLIAAALVGGLLLALLVVGTPMIGVALCLAPAMWIYGGNWDLTIGQVAGFNVYASDLITVVLVLAALMRLDKFGGRGLAWAWGGIVSLLGLALLQGVAIFGVSAAINEARAAIYLVGAVTWALTVDWAKQDVVKASLILGWMFVVLAAFHLFLYGFGTVDTAVRSSDDAKRVLNSTQALLLALCTSALIFGDDRERRLLMRVSAGIFTAVIVAAQNRSVWVAILGGLAAVLILSVHASRRVQALGVLMLAGVGAVFIAIGSSAGSVASKITNAASDTETWNWRVQSWQELLTSWLGRGPIGVAIGEPFGGGFSRLVYGHVTTVSAHSWYVELLLRSGVFGVSLWVVLIVRGMARARGSNLAALFCGAAFLCFSVAYVLPWNVAPWLGILLTAQGTQQLNRVSNRISAPSSSPAASPTA